jgi:hypothetical protein
MTTSFSNARRIRIRVEQGKKSGLFYARSPDLEGLLLAQPSLQSLHQDIPIAVRNYMDTAFGVQAIVLPLQEDGEDESWVVIPAKLAVREAERVFQSLDVPAPRDG